MIFKLILVIDGWGISSEIALRWMSLDLTGGKLIWVQVMAWCYQTTSHYLHQGWPSSMSIYGVTRPWLVNSWGPVYMLQYNIPTLLQIMACRLFGAINPLSETMLPYCQLDHKEHISVKLYLNSKVFLTRSQCNATWSTPNHQIKSLRPSDAYMHR